MEQLYDLNIEKAVIGTLVSNKDAFDEASEILTKDCFYSTECRKLYSCIEHIVKNGDIPDWFSVARRMNGIGYPVKLNELVVRYGSDYIPIPSLYQNVAILHDLMVKRNLLTLSDEIKTRVFDFQSDPNDIIADITKKTSSFYRKEEGGVFNTTDVLLELQKNISANAEGKKDVTGTPTGLKKFDESTSGLHKGDLIFIAADSGIGKTAIALNISLNAAKYGDPIAWYSMEMSKMQLMARMVAAESGIRASSIMYKPLSDEQIIAIDKAMGDISNCKLYFDDKSTSNIETIESSIRFMVRKFGIRGAIIDYIQLLSMNGRRGMTEEQTLGEYARRLKNLAKELEIWIIALSQLKRDSQNPVPNDNRLRGSGQLKEAADTVMMIYRPEACDPPVRYYPSPFNKVSTRGTALVKVTKGRNVGSFEFIIGFDESRTKFYDLDEIPVEVPPPNPDDVPENIRKQIYEQEQLPF